ncbi:hypothetical protein D3C79_883810 [compost metagenome]
MSRSNFSVPSEAWVRRSNRVGTIWYGKACLRERLIMASVPIMRSRPLTARNSVCTGITSCWLAASALTISTPSSGGLSIRAKSKSCHSCARLLAITRPRPLCPGD